MTFLPKSTVLSLEEIERLIRVFSELGVKKVRLTGGEPLVRRGIDNLFKSIGKIKALDEITLTTNGSQLQSKAQMLKDAGVERINVSLDSLDPLTFKKMTRTGDINKVLDGIHSAIEVAKIGLRRHFGHCLLLLQRHKIVPLYLAGASQYAKLLCLALFDAAGRTGGLSWGVLG